MTVDNRKIAAELRAIADRMDASPDRLRPIEPGVGSPFLPPPPPVHEDQTLVAPKVVFPDRVDMVAQPGMDIEEMIRSAKGVGHLVLGIEGKHDESIRLADKYGGHWGHDSLMSIEIVGLTDDAEIRGLSFHSRRGFVSACNVYNMRLRTQRGARAPVWDDSAQGAVGLFGCGFLPDPDNMGSYGGAGMKWCVDLGEETLRLHIEDCYRAEENGVPVRMEEHWLYKKSWVKLYLINNDMAGGNRCLFQLRTPGYKPENFVHALIQGNRGNDHAQDWGFHNGGYAMTVWESLNARVEILGNEVMNSKYGCIKLAHQPQDAHKGEPAHLLPSGHAHGNTLIAGNECSNLGGDRTCVSVASAANPLVVDNKLYGKDGLDCVIDSSTSTKYGAPPCVGAVVEGDHSKKLWTPDGIKDFA